MLKVQSKGRYFPYQKSVFKDYKNWLVGTTVSFSRVCDITNPKIYRNPAPRNHDRIC